jgi:hypothetical protein
MRKVQSRWAQGPRTFIVGAFVAAGFTVAATAPAFAQAAPAPAAPATQAPAPQTPAPASPGAQPAQPAQPGLTFDGDAGLILMQVKPDKTADFESVMAKLHQALSKSDKPERRQQANGWKIFKSTDPGPSGNVLYVAVIVPAAKGVDYTVAKILYEVFPTEVQAIFPTYRDSFAAGLNKVNLQLVQDFGAAAAASSGSSAPAPATTTPAQPAATTPPPQK